MDANAPPIKPFKTRVQPFVTSGRAMSMTRVMYCFSFYYEVHAVLRSQMSLGKGDHKNSQFSVLWLEADHFSANNFCSVCGNQSYISSSCQEKVDTVFCGFCGRPNHTVSHCPRKAFAWIVFSKSQAPPSPDETTEFSLSYMLPLPTMSLSLRLGKSLSALCPRPLLSLSSLPQVASTSGHGWTPQDSGSTHS